MPKTDKKTILEKYYYTASNPAAFSSAERLYKVLDKKYPGTFSKYFIQKWLDGVDSYSVQKQVRHKFKTLQVRVNSIDAQFEADLSYVGNLAKENDGVNYLLFVIDVFSRFLWIEPLKDKTAKSVLNGLTTVISKRKPVRIRVDKGSEFVNRWVKQYLKSENIRLFTTQNAPKANYVERVQRTFNVLLWRYLRHKRSFRYIDALQRLVDNYNATPHRSLNYTAPKDVSKENEADLWAFMYLKKSPPGKLKRHIPSFKFKVGDLVRISYLKHPFRRAYQQQYTGETFKIAKRYRRQAIPLYKLDDWNDQPIIGQFYEAELNKVSMDSKTLFLIEKVIKRRKRQGKTELLVKWLDYPSSMNSWKLADSVETLGN